VIREVEIDDDATVVRRAEVGALHGVHDITPTAIRRIPRGRVAERDEDPATVNVDPEDRQRADRKLRPADAPQPHGLAGAGRDLEAIVPGLRHDPRGEAEARVIREVAQSTEARAVLRRERRMRMASEELVTTLAPALVRPRRIDC
jgi:hypothetical protein